MIAAQFLICLTSFWGCAVIKLHHKFLLSGPFCREIPTKKQEARKELSNSSYSYSDTTEFFMSTEKTLCIVPSLVKLRIEGLGFFVLLFRKDYYSGTIMIGSTPYSFAGQLIVISQKPCPPAVHMKPTLYIHWLAFLRPAMRVSGRSLRSQRTSNLCSTGWISITDTPRNLFMIEESPPFWKSLSHKKGTQHGTVHANSFRTYMKRIFVPRTFEILSRAPN